MKKYYKLNGIISVAIMALVITLFSCGGNRNDEEIQKDINEKVISPAEGRTQYSNVTAAVKDGNVTLTGSCEGENCADSLASHIKQVDGVKEVENNVQQTQAETDLTLRTSVQSIISKYQGVQADVAGGVVILRGSIQRDQVQPLMNELSSLQAKKIDNQLAIQ